MADRTNQLLSNRVVTIIAAFLAIGILLEGKVYNRAEIQQSVYPLTEARSVIISHRDQIIMAFKKPSDQWLITVPSSAPASTQRIQVLIDSNNQTQRFYAATQLPTKDIFSDAFSINVDGYHFLLGKIEPVSKLRYVMADNKVYLQADHIIPMLRAGTSAFADLAVTSKVHRVTIDETLPADADQWSNIVALGIIQSENITTEPVTTISVEQNQDNDRRFELHRQADTYILVPDNNSFGYLISPQQANRLGLTTFN